MKILLSPAKSLNFDKEIPKHILPPQYTIPQFMSKTDILHKKLKKNTPNELKSLMKISDNLAQLNHTRFQEFSLEHNLKNASPAIFTFSGDVYEGLDAFSLNKQEIERLQDRLIILSGFYGILRPLDLIQPYRLEMGTKLATQNAKDLYAFWKVILTDVLNNMAQKDELIINLASKEYSKVILQKQLKAKWIEPQFKDYKNGKLKTISFFAKKARGYMTNYLAKIEKPTMEDILNFSVEDYVFSKSDTVEDSKPVFIR